MNKELEKTLEDNRARAVSLLQQLIRIPTVNLPGENYFECVSLLEEKLKALSFQTEVLEIPALELKEALPQYVDYPRYNLLGRWDVGAEKTIHFNAHYDVVPVTDGWRRAPFSGKVENGVIYGRGSADMKGSIAALLHALDSVRRSRLKPAFNIEVSFVCDEEIGGDLGAKYLAENELVHADFAVVCEGASARQVGMGHNGVIWLEVKVKGKAAHASRPESGRNAFEKMAALVCAFQPYKDRLRRKSFSLSGDGQMTPTLNLGGTFGQNDGGKTNIVPNLAWFTLDRRVLPNEDFAAAKSELCAFIREAEREIPGLNVEIKDIHSAESYCINPGEGLPQSFARAVASVYGVEPVFHVTPGFTDARFFGFHAGIPTIGYGTGGKNFHGVDEHLPLDDLLKTSKVYAAFMEMGLVESNPPPSPAATG